MNDAIRRRVRRGVWPAGIACWAWLALACATPVGVKRVDARTVHIALTSNVLSTGRLSNPTQIVLRRLNLESRYATDPDAVLSELHQVAAADGRSDVIFALAEASFLRAESTGQRARYRAAAVYAYAYLFPQETGKLPGRYDPRLRIAVDLYNRGLTSGFASDDRSEVWLSSGIFPMPFGELEVRFDESQRLTSGGSRKLAHFVPAGEIEVRGLRNHHRQRGIGAPLAADAVLVDGAGRPAKGSEEARFSIYVGPREKWPVNLFMRLEHPRRQLAEKRLRATLHLSSYGVGTETVSIGGREVPLEFEISSTLAYMLVESSIWDWELKGFLTGDLTRDENRLTTLGSYRRGLIPLVFVHGTVSSSGRWANMVNDLVSDSRIKSSYQCWFFTYDTGNPISYSALLLRESLREAVDRFDPEGDDPALRKMVVVGHSQGGLLAKMTAIDTGSRLWDAVSPRPIGDYELSEESRALFEEAIFIEPLPFVHRLIFIATPQRGSFAAGRRINHWFGSLVKMPDRVSAAGTDLDAQDDDGLAIRRLGRVPSSIDDMTPGNPFGAALGATPVVPEVATHSIIAVEGDGPPEEGNDGIVDYQSAHIEGAESELVVRSGHSVQGHPEAIEEVRRILLLNAGL